jgi:hypothetical protein
MKKRMSGVIFRVEITLKEILPFYFPVIVLVEKREIFDFGCSH